VTTVVFVLLVEEDEAFGTGPLQSITMSDPTCPRSSDGSSPTRDDCLFGGDGGLFFGVQQGLSFPIIADVGGPDSDA